MKKFLLLLALFGFVFTACQSDSDESTPRIELSENRIEVESEPGSYTVDVTSPYLWSAVSKSPWIVVETESGDAGTKELSFKVERNEEENGREGSILLANSTHNLVAELHVIQKAFCPSIIASPETLNFTVEGGTQDVAIAANVEYEISTTANWISYTTTENGITITAPEYAEIDPRTAEVVISNDKYNISKTIKVIQVAFVPEISLEKNEQNFAAKGGVQDIAIAANIDYKVSADAEWLSIKKVETGIKVTAKISTILEERNANITISNDRYNVKEVIKVVQNAVSYSDSHVIAYTSSDGEIVTPYVLDAFGADIVSNSYIDGLGMLVFDAPVTSIGKSAFATRLNLLSIKIPNSVTSIGQGAFASCSYLASITIPDSVQSIGYSCFAFCRNLHTIRGKYASEDEKCLVKDGELLFVSPKISGTYTIPNNVTKIGYNCITYTSSKVELVIPDSVIEIHDVRDDQVITNANKISAFRGAFASSDGTALIKDNTLFGAALYGVKSYTIPDGVKTIKANLFQNSTLEVITIPESISHIEKWAFNSCSQLVAVYCKATTPPTLGAYIFDDLKVYPPIYVPSESVDIYKSAAGWKNFAESIVGYDF